MHFEDVYYDARKPASFTGSVKQIAKYANRSYSDTNDWLQSQDAYTLHRYRRKRFNRRKVFVIGIDHLWQIDLMDVSALSRFNDANNFLLVCIDCFSRYAFAVPTRNKSAPVIRDAFASIIERHLRKPTNLQSDKGREFVNALFQDYLRTNDIHFYTSENDDIKCALAERFIRTLKGKMWRMFTRTKSYRYLDRLDDLLQSYNTTHHSAIKMAPANVTHQNEKRLFREQFDVDQTQRRRRHKNRHGVFAIGDVVRISRKVDKFEKGYYSGWTKELFTVTNIYSTVPKTYGLVDYAGEKIKGKFYFDELQKVTGKDTSTFEVEKVLRTRSINGKKQYLVRWSGYSSKFDSWVDDILS